MSDYPTKSQIAAWNNDGMDPDWKPEIKPRNTLGSKIDALIFAAQKFTDIKEIDGESVVDMKLGTRLQLNIPSSSLKELILAVAAVKGEAK